MLSLFVVGCVAGVGFWMLHKVHRREFPERARGFGFVERDGRLELPMGRAIARIEFVGQGQAKLSLDLTAIVGKQLRLQKWTILRTTRVVTGAPELDEQFDIVDAVAATAYMAPISEVILGIFGDAGVHAKISCNAGVIELSALTTDLEGFTSAWLTRFKMIERSLDREMMSTEERLRRNMLIGGSGLRLRSLQLLEQHFAFSPSHQAARLDGLQDQDPAVRIEAARQAGDASRLEALARDEALADTLRVLAIEAHAGVAARDAQVALLMLLVTDKNTAVSVVAIGKLRTTGAPDIAKRFARLLDVAKGERFLALVDALEWLGDATIEAPLLDVLGHTEDDEKRAVCKLLGKLGTVRSVPALRTEAGRGLKAASTAIAQIQSRIAGAEAGQVSMSPELEGALSVAAKEAAKKAIRQT